MPQTLCACQLQPSASQQRCSRSSPVHCSWTSCFMGAMAVATCGRSLYRPTSGSSRPSSTPMQMPRWANLYNAPFLSKYTCLCPFPLRYAHLAASLSPSPHLVGQVDYMPADVLWQCTSKKKEVAKPDPGGEALALPLTATNLKAVRHLSAAGVCKCSSATGHATEKHLIRSLCSHGQGAPIPDSGGDGTAVSLCDQQGGAIQEAGRHEQALWHGASHYGWAPGTRDAAAAAGTAECTACWHA